MEGNTDSQSIGDGGLYPDESTHADDSHYHHYQSNEITFSANNQLAEKHEQISIAFSSPVTQLVVLPNQQVFLYFRNGKAQLWSIQGVPTRINELSLSPSLSHMTYFADSTVLCYNYEKYILMLIDTRTGKTMSKYHPKVPSESIWMLVNRKPSKILDMISSGMQIVVLPETRIVVIMESKHIVSSLNECLLTVVDFDHPSYLCQINIPDERQRQLNLTALNNSETLMVLGSTFTDECLDMLVVNVRLGDKGITPIKFEDKVSFDVVGSHALNEREVSIWVNQQQPSVLIADWVNGRRLRIIPLNVGTSILNEVYFVYTKLQTALIQVNTPEGEQLCLLNMEDSNVTFMKYVMNDSNMAQKVIAPDGSYFVEFEQLSKQAEYKDEPSTFYFTVNSIVGIRASLLYLIEKRKILERYGQFAVHQIINMLTNSDSPSII